MGNGVNLTLYALKMSKGKKIPASFFLPIGQDAPPHEEIEAFFRSSSFQEGTTYSLADSNHTGFPVAVEEIEYFVDDSSD